MKIHLHDMVFYGFHGVYPEEQKLGQRFIVNLTFETDKKNDKDIVNLEDTIDYTKIYDEIKHVMENKKFILLENCANEILDSLMLAHSLIINMIIKIKKPSVPIQGSLGGVEVEMERSR